MSVTADEIYQSYVIIRDANKSKIGDYTKEYEQIISGVKGGEKEKRIAAKAIAMYFKHFPSLHYQAIEAVFDMCEDDDVTIRKLAMGSLPLLCKECKENTSKVADILAQLLQLDDPQEHAIATRTLQQVIENDPLNALKGLFKQMQGGEITVREKCIKFLNTKIPSISSSVITKDIEDFIISEVKKTLEEHNGEDLTGLIQYLCSSKLKLTPAGQQEIVDICSEHAEIGIKYDLSEENEHLDRFIHCTNKCMLSFAVNIDPSRFIIHICENILPHFEIIENKDKEIYHITILKMLAELCSHCKHMDKPLTCVVPIFDMLKVYMPLPPENREMNSGPIQNFTVVECLLYAFHRLARFCKEFLEENDDVLKDFRIRLQYFSRGVQGCMKALKDPQHMSKEKSADLAKSYRVTSNINVLIKDLFYKPPHYKSTITLSWKVDEDNTKTEGKVTPSKRHMPISFDSDGSSAKKRNQDNVKLYQPPSGKFSNNFQNQSSNYNDRRPVRGRGRGRPRGRGMRGNWRGSNRN